MRAPAEVPGLEDLKIIGGAVVFLWTNTVFYVPRHFSTCFYKAAQEVEAVEVGCGFLASLDNTVILCDRSLD